MQIDSVMMRTIHRLEVILVVGDKEVESQTVSVRLRGNQSQGSAKLDHVLHALSKANSDRSLQLTHVNQA